MSMQINGTESAPALFLLSKGIFPPASPLLTSGMTLEAVSRSALFTAVGFPFGSVHTTHRNFLSEKFGSAVVELELRGPSNTVVGNWRLREKRASDIFLPLALQ